MSSSNEYYNDDSAFIRLHHDITRVVGSDTGVLDLFSMMRYLFIESHRTADFMAWASNIWSDEAPEYDPFDTVTYVEQYLSNERRQRLLEYIHTRKFTWGDVRFHIENRLTTEADLQLLVLEILRVAALQHDRDFYSKLIKDIGEHSGAPYEVVSMYMEHEVVLKNKAFSKFLTLAMKLNGLTSVLDTYDMSILPLNALLPIETLMKYIPEEDYFSHQPSGFNPDPYGHESHRIRGRHNIWLGTRMFKHSLLMDVHTFCPVGCVGCYKTFYTREKGPLHLSPISSETLDSQVQETTEWLNGNPEVYDIIISGGEPLIIDLDSQKIANLFRSLEKAKHLRIVRICTGLIFQGLPFRLDDPLLEIISSFSKRTGKRFTFQAHLSSHYQMTPEALIAIRKIREKGFNIYSQVPIQEGINFFRTDLDKTMNFLVKLGRQQVRSEIEPYKYIVDMHPRTTHRYVPIELLCRVWSKLSESHDFPELERAKTLSILCKEGNIILSGYALRNMEKKVDREKEVVVYKIPAVLSIGAERPRWERTYTYDEPLMPGWNDDPESLSNIKAAVQCV